MIKVTLRKKAIADGTKQSLYLDFYPAITRPDTGKTTRREFLKLYVKTKPKTQQEKQQNKEMLQLAEQIRQKRDIELNKPEVYTDFERQQLKFKEIGLQSFLEYWRKLAAKRKASNYDNWQSALNYLEDFTNGHLTFADVDVKFCNDFKEYLLTTKSRKSHKVKLSQNSAVSYFNKLKAALKQAYKDGLLQENINAKVTAIKAAPTNREYLTLTELQKLANTPCQNVLMKQAALFSALTGLRFSDIQKLTWGEIEERAEDGERVHVIRYTQKKTKKSEILYIGEQAYSLMGEKGAPDTKVFEGLEYSAYHNKSITQWIGAAGITKNITFHCFRHTFATLQLANGTDIYTVSKMLGHKELKTTQIYGKVVNEAKRNAANKIQLDMRIFTEKY